MMRHVPRMWLTGLLLGSILACAGASSSIARAEPKKPDAPRARASEPGETRDDYCANVAAAAGAARNARQEKRLAELETQLQQRLAELEAKRAELIELVDRNDAFVRRVDDAVVDVYARMRPEAAAEQLASLEEDSAAALLLRLKPKTSSAIMSLMDAARAASLVRKLTGLASAAREGKRL